MAILQYWNGVNRCLRVGFLTFSCKCSCFVTGMVWIEKGHNMITPLWIHIPRRDAGTTYRPIPKYPLPYLCPYDNGETYAHTIVVRMWRRLDVLRSYDRLRCILRAEAFFAWFGFHLDLWMVLDVFLYRYEGQFDGGKCHGRGTYLYANGNRWAAYNSNTDEAYTRYITATAATLTITATTKNNRAVSLIPGILLL